MGDDRHGDRRDGAPIRPSPVAAARLRSALQAEVSAYADELDIDLDDVARAASSERQDLAADVIREHIARLELFHDEVRQLLAGAMVEREAESVVAAASETSEPAPTSPEPTDATPVVRNPVPAMRGVAVMASLLALLAFTAGQPARFAGSPVPADTTSEGVITAERQPSQGSDDDLDQLAALTMREASTRSDLDPATPHDHVVRERLDGWLAQQHDSLVQLFTRSPSIAAALEDLRRAAGDPQAALPATTGEDAPGLAGARSPARPAPQHAEPAPSAAVQPSRSRAHGADGGSAAPQGGAGAGGQAEHGGTSPQPSGQQSTGFEPSPDRQAGPEGMPELMEGDRSVGTVPAELDQG